MGEQERAVKMQDIVEIKVHLGQLETSMKQAFHMINDQKDEIKTMRDIASSVEKLAYEMSAMREDQNTIKEKVEAIENKPLKTYDAVKMQIILSVITAIVGFFVGKIF